MKPGDRLLQAEIVLPDKTVLVAAEALLIFVPLPGEDAEVLILSQPDDTRIPVRVLQGAEPGSKPGELGIVSVDSDASGHVVVRGTGAAGQKVRLYLDDEYRGQVSVGKDGRWALTLDAVLSASRHTLRVDRISADARQVEERVETTFEPPGALSEDGDRVVIVRPGNSLWTLARQVYGSGWRYTVLFDANRDQIRDPDLIYPGQKLRAPPSDEAGKDP
nr:LysM peptidoglycan-binding domain-containing protein [Phaeovibrio sulfidiphilus]